MHRAGGGQSNGGSVFQKLEMLNNFFDENFRSYTANFLRNFAFFRNSSRTNEMQKMRKFSRKFFFRGTIFLFRWKPYSCGLFEFTKYLIK